MVNKKEMQIRREGRQNTLRILLCTLLILAMTLTFTFADKSQEELKDERIRARRQRNEETMSLSEEDLEKLRPRKPRATGKQENPQDKQREE